MSKDTSLLSDIGKMNLEKDGSYDRKPSTFRHFIQDGGTYPPEKGMGWAALRGYSSDPDFLPRQVPLIRLARLS